MSGFLLGLYNFYLSWNNTFRKVRFFEKRKKLYDKKITILSKNCLAGCIYNSLGMEFCSPTINIFFKDNDFYKFVNNLDDYLESELIEGKNENYPCGILIGKKDLDDLHLLFVHYKTFDEGKKAWERRKTRVLKDKIIIVDSIRDFEVEHVHLFNSIKYSKVGAVFDKTYVNSELCFSKYLNTKKYDESEILTYKGFFGKRKFDIINYVQLIERL